MEVRRPAALVVLLASGLMTACAGQEPAAPPPAAPSAPPPEPEAAPWRATEVEVAYADGLAATDGAVFTKTDDGHVMRIDPETATVAAEARVDTSKDPASYCLGIGSDGESLWSCSAGTTSTDLVRLDPDSLEVLAKASVDKVFDQLTLPVVGGLVWVLTGTGDELVAVAADGTKATTYPLGRRCLQLAATETTVYATCSPSDEVVAVDVATGSTVTAEVSNPFQVAASGNAVWVSGDELIKLEPDLSGATPISDLVAGPEGDLVVAGGDLWLRNQNEFLYRLDPDSGEVRAHYEPDAPLSGGSVLVANDTVWVTAYDDNLVIRVDPEER